MAAQKRTWWVITGIGLAILLIFFVNAVIQVRTENGQNEKLQVLTTFTVLADMAKNIAGDKADVESITKPGAEIHGYEPTPGDIVRMQKADVVLDNGMNLEKWAEKLYQNVKDVPHVTVTEGIEPMSIAEGPYAGKPNPHAWMSPTNALKYADTITKALSNIDPENKASYEQNAAVYKQQISEVDTKLRGGLAQLPADNRYLVSCEGAFSYLIRDYDLKELYLWPINADAQGTPQQIKSVVETVKAHAIPAVFCESTVSSKAMEQVAQETGTRFAGTFYVDSLSADDGPTPTYLKLLEYNSSTLLNGVGK
jgi:ABC-type Zn uptake system ZnuABC Zn-binding protein ZnuA